MPSLDLSAHPTQHRHGATPPPRTNVQTAIPKWKQSLITILPAWLISSVLAPVLGACFPEWPFLFLNLVVTVILVLVLTYLILPVSTRLLHGWLLAAPSTPAPRRTRRSRRRALLSPRLQLLTLLGVSVALTGLVAQTQPSALASAPVSPLIWGTNLNLSTAQDLFLTDPATVKLTQQMHVQLIRFPYRGDFAVTEAAAKQIAALHATPLLILPYGVEQVTTDQTLIQMMNRVFGTQRVYYEFGNEQDVPANGGISAAAYTASWNTVIAQVKPLAPAGRFIGPVTSHADTAYLRTFLKQANPRPDAVSWHEETCGSNDPDATCMQRITTWGTHIQQARTIMQQALGRLLPIAITAYTWNAHPQTDPRATNSAFLGTWMSTAIAELIRDTVFAASQSALTTTALPLIDDRTQTLTAAGVVFQSTFEAQVFASATPTPSGSITPMSTPGSTPTTIATSGATTQLCFQEQGTARVLCLPLTDASGKTGSAGQAAGTLCLPFSPATGQPQQTMPFVCVPVYATSISAVTPTPATSPTVRPVVTPIPTPLS
ncbi:hypothetical protein KSF_087270 [Reticulibacter mediterranei]|uniref:Uncharacterized protein n=1 Tax=Reticulibacter mediterranei TaxID=2778369 RepID=A0A8J3N535_9CHLR|nr:hypothetical protein [Reticulibacter mediterranei]GHO98679.1 hypothetical protein KSF_087270 [Reticulibacter mediterranei]